MSALCPIDASYGTNTAFRTGIGALGADLCGGHLVDGQGAAADPSDRVSVKALALGPPNHAWRTITWRGARALRCARALSGCACASQKLRLPLGKLFEPFFPIAAKCDWIKSDNDDLSAWDSVCAIASPVARVDEIQQLVFGRWFPEHLLDAALGRLRHDGGG
jgi:hypothetical protein